MTDLARGPTTEERDYCCARMAAELSLDCDRHAPRRVCPDVIVDRLDDGSYGLVIHDGGSSLVLISFCPWCAAKVPA